MKKFRLIMLLSLLVLVMVPGVSGLQEPNITYIPERFSANSSMAIIVDPHNTEDSVRVMWIAFTGYDYTYGSFPKINNQWVCYFSETDPQSTCGASPFRVSQSSPGGYVNYPMNITTLRGGYETVSKREDVEVGGITLTADITVDEQNSTIDMVIFPRIYTSDTVNWVSYKVYDSDFSPLEGMEGSLEKQVNAYVGSVSLDPGEYFITFQAESDSDYGGTLERLVIGGDIVPGEYDLEAEPVNIPGILIDSGQEYRNSNFRMTNLGPNALTGLSVSIPSGLSQYLDIELTETSLNASDSMYFTVVLRNIENTMDINTILDVKSGAEVVGKIEVDVKISVRGGCVEECPSSSGTLALNPRVITGDYLRHEGDSITVYLTNNGGDTINLSNTIESGLSNTVTLENFPTSIDPQSSVNFNVNIESASTGSRSGEITIEGNGVTEVIVVSLNFYDNISSELDMLEQDLDNLVNSMDSTEQEHTSTIVNTIRTTLTSARSSFNSGNYRIATENYEEAYGMYRALDDVHTILSGCTTCPPCDGEASCPDLMILLIIGGVVAVGAGVALYFFKFRKKSVSEEEFEESEEEMEEEFF